MKKTIAIALTVTFLLILASIFYPAPFNFFDTKWIDVYFNIRGPIPTQNNIAIATIDEKSLTQLEKWPWPRSTMAQLVDKLAEYEVKAIGFNITFTEGSPEDELLVSSLKKFPNTFLGYFFYHTKEEWLEAGLNKEETMENDQNIHSSRLIRSSKQLARSGKKVYGVQANTAQLSQATGSDRQGFFNVLSDADGVIRTLPLILFYKGDTYPSLSLQIASHTKGFSPIPLFMDQGIVEGIAVGDIKIPLTPTGEFFINYRGPSKTFPHVSIADILGGNIQKDTLRDKILLIGATAIGIHHPQVTPMDSNFSGVEVQANVIDNILAGDFLISNTKTQLASLGLVLFIGLFLGIVMAKLRPLNSFLLFTLLINVLLTAGYFLFSKKNLLIYNFKPFLNGILVYGGIAVYHYFTEEREKRKIKNTFQHYLSPVVIHQLLENPDQLKLGGARKILTVLFSDIRDFTRKAEKLPPEKVVRFLNDYFTVMTEVIFKYEGTIDKFEGDAIMAFFGAPIDQADHAKRASFTALEMLKQLKKHKERWCRKYDLEDLRIGIGIHTGPMAVGNMGSKKRFNYTVIGDSVNLASRLEGLTKEYAVPILVSDAHYQNVKGVVTAKKLEEVQIKGKEERVLLYQLLGKKE